MTLKRFWISWWWHPETHGVFTLSSPWWQTSTDTQGRESICAAVLAPDEAAARDLIFSAFAVEPAGLEFRFFDQKPGGWDPFGKRFPRRDWMVWPDHAEPVA